MSDDGPAGDAQVTQVGDPACWLQWVCDECGAIADAAEQRDDARCARCGAALHSEAGER